MGVPWMDLAGMAITRAKDANSRERGGGTKKRSAFQVHRFLSLMRGYELANESTEIRASQWRRHCIRPANGSALAEDVERPA